MDPNQPQHHAADMAVGCEFGSRLGAFHDGELDADAERIVERHLASCEACRAELQEIRELSDMAGQIGIDGMSQLARRRIHKAIDGEQQYGSIFRIAGVLTGLAASVMVIGAAWLVERPDTGRAIVVLPPESSDKWDYLALNLRSDPLPTTQWEVNNQQMLAQNDLTNWMVEGLSGSGR
jgi:hypothetical protein